MEFFGFNKTRIKEQSCEYYRNLTVLLKKKNENKKEKNIWQVTTKQETIVSYMMH